MAHSNAFCERTSRTAPRVPAGLRGKVKDGSSSAQGAGTALVAVQGSADLLLMLYAVGCMAVSQVMQITLPMTPTRPAEIPVMI